MNTSASPSWDLASIYKRAFHLTKQNKKLWILGLAVAVFVVTGSNGSSNSGSSSSRRSSPTPKPTPISAAVTPAAAPAGQLPFLNYVAPAAGAAFTEFGYRLISNVGFSFKKVPLATYTVIGLEIVLAAAIFVLIAMAASAWARAALIFGCAQAEAQNTVDLIAAGRTGRQRVRTIISIDYLPYLPVLLVGLLAVSASVVFIFAKVVLLTVLIMVAFVVYAVIAAIRIFLAQIWAYRLAVISGQTYPAAMVRGQQLAAGHVGQMILLAVVNALLDGIISFLLLVPFGGAVLVMIFGAVLHPTVATIITAGLTLIITLILASPLLKLKTAIFNAFAYMTWHLSFKCFNYQPGSLYAAHP